MNVNNTGYTIAEYCDQMNKKSIIVNHDYQRSPNIWPVAARSYLIDTILLGYPIPKIALFQMTDIDTRKTVKEIVDGQQRSMAIQAFFSNRFRITGQSEFSGKKFDDLALDRKKEFIEYQISVDLFVGATEANIRQMFRRMNSYTVPLNPEEKRHATNQGAFKWFIVEITEDHEASLEMLGVFSKGSLARMQDAKLFTELAFAFEHGIETYAFEKLDKFYTKYDGSFPRKRELQQSFTKAIDTLMDLKTIHQSPIVKPFNAYSLILALVHVDKPVAALKPFLNVKQAKRASKSKINHNLELLALAAQATAVDKVLPDLQAFHRACDGATNTKEHRIVRFEWMFKALTDQMHK